MIRKSSKRRPVVVSKLVRLALLGSAMTWAMGAAQEANAAGMTPSATPAVREVGAKVPGSNTATLPSRTQPFAWPSLSKWPRNAPNILLVLLDDVGFGAASTFGGLIATPNFDKLARRGLRYSNFNVTAICSATRAALLTGRNHHRVAMGRLPDAIAAAEGYTSILPPSAGTVAQVLSLNGYQTAHFGKWHLTPYWETSSAGPFDHWPNHMGFDYSYGFLAGDTDQWSPSLVENQKVVEPPAGKPDYILENDLATRAAGWIAEHEAIAPDRPWFIYYASGATHAPHHAPRAWIDRFKGRFDEGWDVVREQIYRRQLKQGIIPAATRLTPRPAVIPSWSSLTARQRRVYARMMEVYAGMLAYTDHEIGRVLDAIDRAGEQENTLVILVSGDNGASAEGGLQGAFNEVAALNQIPEDLDEIDRNLDELGGPRAFNHYPAGWAWAMNTPFQWYKTVASHLGGIRNGAIFSWPEGIPKDETGAIRTQFHHVIDVEPTVLEAIGINAPAVLNNVEQMSLDGTSMLYSFKNAAAPSPHKTQYFEMLGNRALYEDGWIASYAAHTYPFAMTKEQRSMLPATTPEWELYDLDRDFSQSQNVAREYPERLNAMIGSFDRVAVRNHVEPDLPLFGPVDGRPALADGYSNFTYTQPATRLPDGVAAPLFMRGAPFTATATIDVPANGAQGVVMTEGGRFGGYGLYLLNGKPTFVYNLAKVASYRLEASGPIGPGKHKIGLAWTPDSPAPGSGGVMIMEIDGKRIGQVRIERTLPRGSSISEGFDVGVDTGTPVSDDYAAPFPLTAKLDVLEIRFAR